MQNKFNLLYIFIFVFSVNNCYSVNKIETKILKNKIDSLFEIQEYTEAQKLYEILYSNHKIESNDMLLKLALIHEGLGEIPIAIHYLKKYSLLNPDLEIESHIENLAANNNLIGYKSSDYDKAFFYLLKYKLLIVLTLVCITSMLFLIFIYTLLIKKKKMVGLLIPFSIFIVMSFLAIYLIKNKSTGIIKDNSLLMSQASAGAKLKKKIKKGHQVLILDEIDIWCKIELEDEFYYIRKSNLIVN